VKKMPKLEDALEEFNPWWKREFEVDYRKREVYEEVRKFLPEPQIIALTGPRRTGKTTLMYKFIKDLLEEKDVDPERILYFSFDEFQQEELRNIIRKYEELFNINLRDEKSYLFFDEIQKLDNWANQLKTIYDNYKGKVKVFVSGSESLFLRQKGKETLAGRMYEFKVDPLTFREYLKFKGKEEEVRPVDLHETELKKLFEQYTKTWDSRASGYQGQKKD